MPLDDCIRNLCPLTGGDLTLSLVYLHKGSGHTEQQAHSSPQTDVLPCSLTLFPHGDHDRRYKTRRSSPQYSRRASHQKGLNLRESGREKEQHICNSIQWTADRRRRHNFRLTPEIELQPTANSSQDALRHLPCLLTGPALVVIILLKTAAYMGWATNGCRLQGRE